MAAPKAARAKALIKRAALTAVRDAGRRSGRSPGRWWRTLWNGNLRGGGAKRSIMRTGTAVGGAGAAGAGGGPAATAGVGSAGARTTARSRAAGGGPAWGGSSTATADAVTGADAESGAEAGATAGAAVGIASRAVDADGSVCVGRASIGRRGKYRRRLMALVLSAGGEDTWGGGGWNGQGKRQFGSLLCRVPSLPLC